MPSRREGLMLLALLVAAGLFVGGAFLHSEQRTPPTFTPQATSEPEPEPVAVAIYGDSYTGGSGEGGTGPASWPALLQQRIPEMQSAAFSAGGAGYTAVSPATGQTFPTLVADHPPATADVIVIFGSRNDTGAPEDVGHAAADLYADLRAMTPAAHLLVIGPAWVDDDVPAVVERNRDALASAAATAGATFVDPLAEGWFFDRPELIGSDNVHPTDAGHAYMADKIEPHLRQAIGAVAAA